MTWKELMQAVFKHVEFNHTHAEECYQGFVESDDKASFDDHHAYYIEGYRKALEEQEWFISKMWSVVDCAKTMAQGFEEGINTVSEAGVAQRTVTAIKQLEHFLEVNNEDHSNSTPEPTSKRRS